MVLQGLILTLAPQFVGALISYFYLLFDGDHHQRYHIPGNDSCKPRFPFDALRAFGFNNTTEIGCKHDLAPNWPVPLALDSILTC
jgi:hypothetical protein